jgi:hypothetical protein
MSRPGFHPITPYATVPQAGELIDFLKNAFGVQELFRGTPTPNAVLTFRTPTKSTRAPLRPALPR